MLRRAFAFLAVLSLVAAACSSSGTTTTAAAPSTTQAAPTTTKAAPTTTKAAPTTTAAAACAATIGVMAPITGPAASIGEEQLNWAKLAVDRYNDANGTEFTILEGDTQLDPAQASTIAQQFVSTDDLLGVVGPAGSQEVQAVGPIFTEANLGFVSMSATRTDLTNGDLPTFFRVVPKDDVQGPTDANFMISKLGAKKVFIIDDQTSYSTGLADAAAGTLEAAGVTVDRDSVSQDQSDFSALVAKIADDTDVVFLPWQLAANAQLFGQQMEEQGKNAVLFGSDGLFSPSDFTIEGAYVSAFAPDIKGIAADADLVKAFEDQYGDFGTFGPPTFAATEVVLAAIDSVCQSGATPTREAVVKAIAATDQPESILGQPIRFDANGDVEGAQFFIFTIKDGTYTLVEG